MEQRTRCQIFSRIVGYIRPTAQWNQGKKSEYGDRVCYDVKSKKKDGCKGTKKAK